MRLLLEAASARSSGGRLVLWARTDQLTKLKLDRHGDFTLRDRDGRTILVEAAVLRRDPKVLKVFVAAVRRSVANGLEPNRNAREELGLDRLAREDD